MRCGICILHIVDFSCQSASYLYAVHILRMLMAKTERKLSCTMEQYIGSVKDSKFAPGNVKNKRKASVFPVNLKWDLCSRSRTKMWRKKKILLRPSFYHVYYVIGYCPFAVGYFYRGVCMPNRPSYTVHVSEPTDQLCEHSYNVRITQL